MREYRILSRCVSFDKSIGAAIDARLTTDGRESFLRVIHAFIFNGCIEVRTSHCDFDAQLEFS